METCNEEHGQKPDSPLNPVWRFDEWLHGCSFEDARSFKLYNWVISSSGASIPSIGKCFATPVSRIRAQYENGDHLFYHPRTRREITIWTKSLKKPTMLVVLGIFFKNTGSPIQKTQEGLFVHSFTKSCSTTENPFLSSAARLPLMMQLEV
jgi:hypothetical protein